MDSQKPQILNRYTSLPAALDVLAMKRITLSSPKLWEDQNDAYYIERYRQAMKRRCILAICFSARSETFHHWRVFAGGVAGVCIEFDKERLLRSFIGKVGFRTGDVTYKWIGEVKKEKPELALWPFLKRKQYEDEGEFRIIYESRKKHLGSKSVRIGLAAIRKVTLSPWLSDKAAESVMEVIGRIEGCSELPVNHSSLIDNPGWRNAIE